MINKRNSVKRNSIKNINNDKKQNINEYESLKYKYIEMEKKYKEMEKKYNEMEKKYNKLHKNEKLLGDKDVGLIFEFDKKIGSYDIIIDIQSIKDLPKKGWKIKYPNENGKDYYMRKKKEKTIVVGVIGNRNKGKSFLLEKLSGYEIPIGFNIKTEGLSVRYAEKNNHNIAILDSAGQETSLYKEFNYNDENNNNNEEAKIEDESDLKDQKNNYSFNEENNLNEEKINFEENSKNDFTNKGNGSYKVKNDTKSTDNDDNNQLIQKENYEDYEFEEYSRDKLISEFFIQKFIIFKSNILILVIGNITLNEQKLISRIKKEAGKDKNIFVIHNLQNFNTKEQVDDYINGTLKNLYNIELEENYFQDIKNNIDNSSRYFNKYFVEEGGKIAHIIFINEFCEVGKFYNVPALKFLISQIESTMQTQEFDIIEDCKNFLIDISEEIIEENLKQEDFTIEPEKNSDILKINGDDKILNLKKFVVDEMGYSLNIDSNIPNYSHYIKDNFFYIFIELPGGGEIEDDIKIITGYYIFLFEGIKKGDIEIENDKNNFNGKLKYKKSTRKNNKFKLKIKIPNTVIQLENNKPYEKPKFEKGVIEYKYKILDFGKEKEREKQLF